MNTVNTTKEAHSERQLAGALEVRNLNHHEKERTEMNANNSLASDTNQTKTLPTLEELASYAIDIRRGIQADWELDESNEFYERDTETVYVIPASEQILVYSHRPHKDYVRGEFWSTLAREVGEHVRDGAARLEACSRVTLRDGRSAIRVRLSEERKALVCDRPGCQRRGLQYMADECGEPDHVCSAAESPALTAALDELPRDTDFQLEVWFEPMFNSWQVAPHIVDAITAKDARLIAKAIAAAADIADQLNGIEIRRDVEACAAPEHDGVGGGL